MTILFFIGVLQCLAVEKIKKELYLLNVQSSNDKKLTTTQDCQTL